MTSFKKLLEHCRNRKYSLFVIFKGRFNEMRLHVQGSHLSIQEEGEDLDYLALEIMNKIGTSNIGEHVESSPAKKEEEEDDLDDLL